MRSIKPISDRIKQPEELLPPLLFPAATSTGRKYLAALKAEGKIRKIGPRLYTSVPKSQIKEVVLASWSRYST